MKIVQPINPMPDGVARTLKANYQQTSPANMIRGGGTFAATGVIEYEGNEDNVCGHD